MPKIDGTHILQRLTERLAQLEDGEEIAAKEIRSLLTPEQLQELESAWEEQQELRKAKRARTVEEEKELGWKSKREVRIEVFKKAIATAWENIDKVFDGLKHNAEVRQGRIYIDTLNEALKAGVDEQVAKNLANNKLTQSKLKRLDEQIVRSKSVRDEIVNKMEDALRARFLSEATAEELEQLKLSEEHDKMGRKTGRLVSSCCVDDVGGLAGLQVGVY